MLIFIWKDLVLFDLFPVYHPRSKDRAVLADYKTLDQTRYSPELNCVSFWHLKLHSVNMMFE